MHDLIEEITGTLRRNKLRSAMTGFAVTVGIFLLIVLLGAGNGILHAFAGAVKNNNLDLVSIYRGYTSKPYAGLKEGRQVSLEERDGLTARKGLSAQVVAAMPQQSKGVNFLNGQESVSGQIIGVMPEYGTMNNLSIVRGRFLNLIDIMRKRRMAVISESTEEQLFDKGHSALGRVMVIDSLCYEVVGVYANKNFSNNTDAFVPYTTLQTIYKTGKTLDILQLKTVGLNSKERSTKFDAQMRNLLAINHQFNPTDEDAVYISSNYQDAQSTSQATAILTKAIWIIGLLTMLSGVVGISNIMLITVRERTHEFGIRKALGAKPWSILRIVILESVVITSFFGYLGLVLGVAATEYLNYWSGHQTITMGGQTMTVFSDPTVDFSIALESVLVLIIAGMLAGLFPARKAVHVKPIEALRAE